MNYKLYLSPEPEDDDHYLAEAFGMNAGGIIGTLVSLPFPAAMPVTGVIGVIAGGCLARAL